MFRNIPALRRAAILIASTALIYQSSLFADQLALPSGDLIAPTVDHEPIGGTIPPGENYQIAVKVTDNVGVKSVLLFYRTIGAANYSRVLLSKSEGDIYKTQFPVETVAAPGIEYYIQAEDLAGNTLLHGYSFSPLIVKVAPLAGGGEKGIALTEPTRTPTDAEPFWKNKWVWIGLGVVAVAAASGGGDGGTTTTTATVNVTEPTP